VATGSHSVGRLGSVQRHDARLGSLSMLVGAMCAAAMTAGCGGSAEPEVIVMAETAPAYTAERSTSPAASEELSPRVLRRFAPLPEPSHPLGGPLVDLGRMLYYEPRLSKTGTLSCNSCHELDRYGTTQTAFAKGVGGQLGSRNPPSVYHAAGHFVQFWDGRSPTIEAQAKEPIQNPNEMDMTPEEVVTVLNGIEGYAEPFAKAFPGRASPITFDNVAKAISAFERGLATPARWDRYLGGDTTALTAEEKEGAKVFANLGCLVCHTGPYVGGSMFEKLGARESWPSQRDRGRREVTGNDADDMVFKVPSLRNVARTGPYFHDGSAATLEEAVRLMARHQLGIDLQDDEVRYLEAWLGSLTGDLPTDYIAKPTLPGVKPALPGASR
jgi:cytochrome c peroxidase